VDVDRECWSVDGFHALRYGSTGLVQGSVLHLVGVGLAGDQRRGDGGSLGDSRVGYRRKQSDAGLPLFYITTWLREQPRRPARDGLWRSGPSRVVA
jgi:hypothetical protein